MRHLLLTAAILSAIAAPAAATTIGSLTQTGVIDAFGYPNTTTYGQTVVVPFGVTQLDEFTFRTDLPDALDFRAYVYGWDGNKATTQLFASGNRNSPGAGVVNNVVPVNIPVTAGQQLVLFFSISEIFEGEAGAGVGVYATNTSYAPGGFVYMNNDTNESLWTSQNWDKSFYNLDLAFNAVFSDAEEVPEPAMLGLFGLGALGLGLTRRRKA